MHTVMHVGKHQIECKHVHHPTPSGTRGGERRHTHELPKSCTPPSQDRHGLTGPFGGCASQWFGGTSAKPWLGQASLQASPNLAGLGSVLFGGLGRAVQGVAQDRHGLTGHSSRPAPNRHRRAQASHGLARPGCGATQAPPPAVYVGRGCGQGGLVVGRVLVPGNRSEWFGGSEASICGVGAGGVKGAITPLLILPWGALILPPLIRALLFEGLGFREHLTFAKLAETAKGRSESPQIWWHVWSLGHLVIANEV